MEKFLEVHDYFTNKKVSKKSLFMQKEKKSLFKRGILVACSLLYVIRMPSIVRP